MTPWLFSTSHFVVDANDSVLFSVCVFFYYYFQFTNMYVVYMIWLILIWLIHPSVVATMRYKFNVAFNVIRRSTFSRWINFMRKICLCVFFFSGIESSTHPIEIHYNGRQMYVSIRSCSLLIRIVNVDHVKSDKQLFFCYQQSLANLRKISTWILLISIHKFWQQPQQQ